MLSRVKYCAVISIQSILFAYISYTYRAYIFALKYLRTIYIESFVAFWLYKVFTYAECSLQGGLSFSVEREMIGRVDLHVLIHK